MPKDRELDPRIGGRVNDPRAGGVVDRAIAALAARQHGVVSRGQLLDAGLTVKMVDARCGARRLLPLHRGVYAVGHASLTRNGLRFAALLAAGPGAALSHREAAALHALLPSAGTRVEVTVSGQRRVPGVIVWRARLEAADVTSVDGMPVTTLARTLVDLAAVAPGDRLRKALGEAERSYRLDVDAIEAVLRRTRGRKGHGPTAIRTALSQLAADGTTITFSELEDRFLVLLDACDLPRPKTNQLVEGMQVDALWPRERVVVELDGYAHHNGRQAFGRDRERGNDLTVAGWTVMRFTHGHVVGRPAWVADRVRRALAQAAAPTA